MRCRQHDDWQQGAVAPQFGKEIKTTRTRQREVEQHHRTIGMAGEEGQRFHSVGGAENLEAAVESWQYLLQRMQYQRMVVDDQYFHGNPPKYTHRIRHACRC